MSLSINTNLSALNAYRNFGSAQTQVSKSLERLASGSRINWASDDAAGLAISEGLRSQINGSNVAMRNAQDAMSLLHTAEGGMKGVQPVLSRLRELALSASNDTLTEDARTGIAAEATLLIEELNSIAETTSFNGISLLDGTAGTAGVLKFQIGANSGDSNQIEVDLSGANVTTVATALGSLDFTTSANALTALGTIDAQITSVSNATTSLGSYYNRFERVTKSLSVAVENLSAAESRIRDTDVAQETANLTKSQIKSEYAAAMLAQAIQSPQRVLSLLM